MSIESEPLRWTILAVANIPVYLGLGSLFFGDFQEFLACVGYWFKPDWLSFLRGEWVDDWWAELKLFMFAALCLLALYGEYRFFFGDLFRSEPVAQWPGPHSGPLDRSIQGPPRFLVGPSCSSLGLRG